MFNAKDPEVKAAERLIKWDTWFSLNDLYKHDLKQVSLNIELAFVLSQSPDFSESKSRVLHFESPFKDVYPDLYSADAAPIAR